MILALPACAWGQPDSVAAAFSDGQAGQSVALSVGEVPLNRPFCRYLPWGQLSAKKGIVDG